MRREQPAYLLVKDRSNLSRIAARLERETAIGVDLEADSMFHYQEKVCLIQISTPLQDILVDPLSLDDLSPLSPVFGDPNIRKVFHGADYDIRSLYRDFDIEVNSLFDTQIAARFLGIKETGLAHLLKENLGVLVEKKYQKKDWSERPLPAAMRAYAVQDTCHLLPLSRILEKELRVKGRLFCVEEECELLSKVRPAPPDANPLFLRFKGASRLDPRDLAVLESIMQLRDDTARRRDLPPFKILGNAQIMEIVERKPVTERDLRRIKGLSARQVRMLGRSILKKIDESTKLPENELPAFPRNTEERIGAKVLKKVKALREWRGQRAKEMGNDPSLVCTNNQIHSLALAHPKKLKDLEDIDTIKAWQRRLFGSEICHILKGIG
ncbi:MAG: HRDC domain-containing protein [Desulfobacteraceae bacterium]|nr:HRDC domain-containing protein [Desulfobacteraceae bacterium]